MKSPTPAAPAETNGALPAPPAAPEAPAAAQNGAIPNLPEGTIQLPPGMATILTRLLQSDQRVQDALYAYLQGLGRSEPLALVVPVFLLVRPKEQ